MQDIGTAFEVETRNLRQSCIYIQTAISKRRGNCKPIIYNRYTHLKEKAIQTHY